MGETRCIDCVYWTCTSDDGQTGKCRVHGYDSEFKSTCDFSFAKFEAAKLVDAAKVLANILEIHSIRHGKS